MTATETCHKVVSRDEWLKARVAHLTAEKEFTRKRDELSRKRRELPWVRVDKNYVFEGPNGPKCSAQAAIERKMNAEKKRSFQMPSGKNGMPSFCVSS